MTDRRSVRVELGQRSYDIVVDAGLLDDAGSLLRPLLKQPKVVVVTDTNLAATDHPMRLQASLERAGIAARAVVMPAGEGSKSLSVLSELLDDLLKHGAERGMTLVALGGGVIGDLVGFAAALLLRGVDYVQVPTTLLAQVDSAVGGKTGINSRYGKNLIGAFHQPRIVLIDTDVLDDLPSRELRAGYAEVVKYGFIRDPGFFSWLEDHGDGVLGGDASARAEAVLRSVQIKAAIVAADEHETKGERALLNFGHTFAHAYESLGGFDGTLLHGEAVAIGMADAFALSAQLGVCSAEDRDRAIAHLQRMDLPVRISDISNGRFPVDELVDAMGRDKKVENARLRFILARRIGEAFVTADVPMEAVRSVLARHG